LPYYVFPVAFFLLATVPRRGHRQTAAVPQSAVGAHLDVTLDVHRDFLAEVAFHGAFLLQNLADAVNFVLAQIADFLVELDTRPIQQRFGTGAAYAVNVSQPDLGPLSGGKIYSCDTRHS
jgi:hypothetical protein